MSITYTQINKGARCLCRILPKRAARFGPPARFRLVNTRSLLIVTALVEVGTAMGLLATPSLTVELLLGTGLSSPPSLVVGRVTGAALIALGAACWLARNGDRGGGAQT